MYRDKRASVHWVRSHERRAAVFPLINRLSTRRFVPPAVYTGLPLFVLPKSRSGQLSTTPRRAKGWLSSGRTDLSVSRPTPHRPATPRCAAPSRPWYDRVLDSTGANIGDCGCSLIWFCSNECIQQSNLQAPNKKTYLRCYCVATPILVYYRLIRFTHYLPSRGSSQFAKSFVTVEEKSVSHK